MANANDPQGISARRVQFNAVQTARSAEILAHSGDSNGLRDLQLKNCEAGMRLNGLQNTSTAGIGVNMMGTAFAGFGLENMST